MFATFGATIPGVPFSNTVILSFFAKASGLLALIHGGKKGILLQWKTEDIHGETQNFHIADF